MDKFFPTKDKKTLIGLNIASLIAFIIFPSMIHPTVWYEPVIEVAKNNTEVNHGAQSRVFIVDAEIPTNHPYLNVVESVDFTGEGFIGEECSNSHGVKPHTGD